ncbi:MAG: TRAP transporter TatT component family protein [Desulfobulbales bacterium]|nr:TRAP transporter TatT component family protein [Desulfobulbales bacterium]
MIRKATASLFGNIFPAVLVLLFSSGCASLFINPLLDPLTLSLEKQTDLDLLQEGAPALLLILDGLIVKTPGNERLLLAATKAYAAYATTLFTDGQTERAAAVSAKAKTHGISLIRRLPGLENIKDLNINEIDQALAGIPPDRVDHLFWGAYGWATWIQYQEGAPVAMADLPIVERIMLRVVELDESYYYGGAHIFLGSYYGSRPKMYGGEPGKSRKHFERALELNKRKFLLTHVAYAQTYARQMFDRELYFNLLTEVLEQPLTDSEMASSNKLAKISAQKLMDRIDEFF